MASTASKYVCGAAASASRVQVAADVAIAYFLPGGSRAARVMVSDFRLSVPYASLADETRLYYEFLGPEDGPTILQFGGGLFGRHNFGAVNEGFQGEGFRLLAFDARGYGASDHPHEQFTIEGWADDGAALLDALGLDRVLVHGTSMGGMIAIAFAAKHGDRRSPPAPTSPSRSRTSTARPSSASGGAWPSPCPGTTSPTT